MRSYVSASRRVIRLRLKSAAQRRWRSRSGASRPRRSPCRAPWRRSHSSSRSCAARPARRTSRTACARSRASGASREALKQIDVLRLGRRVRSDRPCPRQSGLAITFGAYCGSIRTTSAPIAFSRMRPSCSSDGVRRHGGRAARELVPTCHSTRSGCSAMTSRSNRASMSAASSPLTPRLSTVIRPGEIAGSARPRAGSDRRRRRACARAGGRGRADGDDLDRLAAGERCAMRAAEDRSGQVSGDRAAGGRRGRGAGAQRGAAPSVCACATAQLSNLPPQRQRSSAARRSKRRRCMAMCFVLLKI